ncbi:hypothetical protein [Kordia sp.]|uniref:hypothetical protein n=1 Tax=Kordia sp. TaxID=1965332 RepID=UPI003B58CA1E
MFKKISIISCILCFLNCEQQPKQFVENSRLQDSLPKIEAVKTVDETGYEPFDASEYLSTQLLIGKSETFRKEKIKSLFVAGDNSYEINHQGLITAQYDISNNYSEFTYTESGLLKTIAYKQHSPALTYHEETLYYKKDKTLQKSVVSSYNQQTKETTTKTITDLRKLKKKGSYFKVNANKESFKINREKRILLTYGNDLLFCCGELMPGKNSLHYYYVENQLIDSLVINGLESGKKMVFKYTYNN